MNTDVVIRTVDAVLSFVALVLVAIFAVRIRRLQRRMEAAVTTAEHKVERRARQLVDELDRRIENFAIDQADKMTPVVHSSAEVCDCIPPINPYRRPWHCAVKGSVLPFGPLPPELRPRRIAGDAYTSAALRTPPLRPEDAPTAVRPLPPRPVSGSA